MTPKLIKGLYLALVFTVFFACAERKSPGNSDSTKTEEKSTASSVKQKDTFSIIKQAPAHIKAPEGMVWIPGSVYMQGAVPGDDFAMAHEKPQHSVAVNGFFMDLHEVTNAQFARFVKETNYITVAERPIDWEEMKKQLPEGTPKPHDSIMQPGSLVFRKPGKPVPNLYDFSQWWMWKIGANWKMPKGPGSSIKGKEAYPVVHIAYEDAVAYCEWAGRRLPTEAEWELAARAGKQNQVHSWGDDAEILAQKANTWTGEFPVANTKNDGFEGSAPVKNYPPNDFGLYDMSGNVWEWTADWYNTNYYKELNSGNTVYNPSGSATPYNAGNPYAKEKVIKGGSFLCNASYCASYRTSSRMANSLDSSLEHLGFRTVATVAMLDKE
ncbi:MAG: formylglycine-generating enzyme family protein [Bacteroidota bacterium]